MATENFRLEEYLAQSNALTIIANFRTSSDVVKLSHSLKGKKIFVELSSNDKLDVAEKLKQGDKFIEVDRTDKNVFKLIQKLHEHEEHIVFLVANTADAKIHVGKVDPLASIIAIKITKGRIMPIYVSDTKKSPSLQYELSSAPLRNINDEEFQAMSDISVAMHKFLEQAAYLCWKKQTSLSHALLSAIECYGKDFPIYSEELPTERTINFKTLLLGAFALGGYMAAKHKPGSKVALMLPTSIGTAVTFYACQFAGLVPVMINFGAGTSNIVSACRTSQVEAVYTAKALLKKLEAAKVGADALTKAGFEVTMLEEVREGLGLPAKLKALFYSTFPKLGLDALGGGKTNTDDEAIVLFTSGSEGDPKGVVLSHGNLCTNGCQILSRVATTPRDYIFNSLPLFHSFGMIGGLILPVFGGIKTMQYPSPLMYRDIPKLIKKYKATIMFSTSTFFGKYAQNGSKADFESLELIFAGGEKLKASVQSHWYKEFGKKIYEGFGVTETSPALAISIEHLDKEGSPGPLLANIEGRLVPVEGIEEGGSLNVKGPNVMKGYLFADNPGKIQPLKDSEHDTGDIARFDADNFVYIIGRAKRFAKIAGEMVPLVKVEESLALIFGEELYAIVTVVDENRGEKLVLVSQKKDLELDQVKKVLQDASLPELWAPRRLIYVEDFPLLATGKVDYPAVAKIAQQDTN